MADIYLRCVDCHEEFTFTTGEQEFYTDKGYNQPKRCPTCRRKKKEQRGAQEEKHLNNGKW